MNSKWEVLGLFQGIVLSGQAGANLNLTFTSRLPCCYRVGLENEEDMLTNTQNMHWTGGPSAAAIVRVFKLGVATGTTLTSTGSV